VAATGHVTPRLISRRASQPRRSPLPTGGHDHGPALPIFDGYDDIGPTTSGASATAFQKDFRESADVLVMYDFSPTGRNGKDELNLLESERPGRPFITPC
jgi:hypothetical protein